jgi:hypothetical protein
VREHAPILEITINERSTSFIKFFHLKYQDLISHVRVFTTVPAFSSHKNIFVFWDMDAMRVFIPSENLVAGSKSSLFLVLFTVYLLV